MFIPRNYINKHSYQGLPFIRYHHRQKLPNNIRFKSARFNYNENLTKGLIKGTTDVVVTIRSDKHQIISLSNYINITGLMAGYNVYKSGQKELLSYRTELKESPYKSEWEAFVAGCYKNVGADLFNSLSWPYDLCIMISNMVLYLNKEPAKSNTDNTNND